MSTDTGWRPKAKKMRRSAAPRVTPDAQPAPRRQKVRVRPTPDSQPAPRGRSTPKPVKKLYAKGIRKGQQQRKQAHAKKVRAKRKMEKGGYAGQHLGPPPLAKTRLIGYGVKRGRKDFKVAGINVDEITGVAGRGAIDVLDETTRPAEFLAGAEQSFLKGEDPIKNIKAGWQSGVTRKKRKTGADVVKTLGVKNKTAQKIAGLGLDIAGDPLTYATFGLGAAARTGGSIAAKASKVKHTETLATELAKGTPRRLAKKKASQAAQQAWNKAPKGRGITAQLGKKQLPGITKATSHVRVVSPERADRIRDKASQYLPVRPTDIPEKEWQALGHADRERRGTLLQEGQRTARVARGVRKATGGTQRRLLPERPVAGEKPRLRPRRRKAAPLEASQRVTDALEAKDLTKLSRPEQMAAQAVKGEGERLLQMRRTAGEPASRYAARTASEPKGYVPRQVAYELEDPKARKLAKRQAKGYGGKRKTTTPQDFARQEQRRAPMTSLRTTHPGEYAEDLETVLRAKGRKDVERAANTAYRGRVMETGRPVKKGWDRKTESVYTVKDGRLTEVNNKHFVGGKPEDFVVLKKSVADHAMKQMESKGRIPFLDAATNKIKWALTIPNPQYWTRNAYGGLFNVSQSGVRPRDIARAAPQAARVNRAIRLQHKAEEQLGSKPADFAKLKKPPETLPVGPGGKPIKTADFLKELEQHNVTGGGQVSELLGAESRRRPKLQGFDDLPRFTAYIHFRRKGLAPKRAADKAMESQFDYGALSSFEQKVAKRIFPFWTFRSRNVVLQGKTLLKRPGKLANLEKTRDTAASLAGLPPDWQKGLSEGEALGVPLATPLRQKLPGKLGKTPVLAYAGLPITDLNLLSPKQSWQQAISSTHPGAKAILEFATNYSFFWRDNIEGQGGRFVSAPDKVIDALPKPARQTLISAGILKRGKDRWTGKETWQWRGKADYLAKLTPATSTAVLGASSGLSRKGQQKGQRLAGWATGVRGQPFQPQLNRYYKLQEKRAAVKQKIDDLVELRTNKGRDKAEYQRLYEQYGHLGKQIYELEGKLGKKDRTKPRGGRRSGGPSLPTGGDVPRLPSGGSVPRLP